MPVGSALPPAYQRTIKQFATPLASGCLESRFNVVNTSMIGPIEFSDCIRRCEDHRSKYVDESISSGSNPMAWRRDYPIASGAQSSMALGGACGAISFFDATKAMPMAMPKGKGVRRSLPSPDDRVGFCVLKAKFCTAAPYRARPGECSFDRAWRRRDPTKRGFCTFMLRQPITSLRRRPYAHPPRESPCRGEGDLEPTLVNLTTTRSRPWQKLGPSVRWSDRKRTVGSQYATDSTYSPPVSNGNKDNVSQSSAPVFYEASGKYRNFGAELARLSGGLNNVLMVISQLLTASCADPNGVLLLPPIDIDPLRAVLPDQIQKPPALRARKWKHLPNCTDDQSGSNVSSSMCCERGAFPCAVPDTDPPSPPPPVAPPPPPSPPPGGEQILGGFEDFFDLPYFRSHFAPFCGPRSHNGSAGTFVWKGEPPKGAHIVPLRVEGIGPLWDYTAYTPAMMALYGSLRPSRKVGALVEALTNAAVKRAGPNWSAVHLPISADWWFETGWCSGRRNEVFTKRCYTPRDVAKSTHDARRNATGTVLLFAHDKVATRAHPWMHSRALHIGPSICNDGFGDRTFKLQLPTSIPYMFRNAAEQFFAARAPAGFFGNSFSTFSKGIALMRDSGSNNSTASCHTMRCQCFSYDCAQTDFSFWEHSAKVGIVANHPGFWKLRSLSEFASGEKPAAWVAPPHCKADLGSPTHRR